MFACVSIALRRLITKNLIEKDDRTLSCDFEFPIFEAEEEEMEEIPDEISRLLKQEERIIQPHEETIEIVNLGSEDVRKEIRIGSLLSLSVKERLIKLLKEFSDVFASSYQDMPGLDTSIVEHRLPLKPECPPVKQKLRRSRPELALQIKEEV